MKSSLPYGNTKLIFETPAYFEENPVVISPQRDRRLERWGKHEIKNIVVKGLDKLEIKPDQRVAIAVNDPTRPIPNDVLLPPLLEGLRQKGIKQSNINIFIATGTHKYASTLDLKDLISDNICNNYRTIVHDCDDAVNLVYRGNSSKGTPIYVNKQFIACELKIVTGHIEPHHFMGYSGGVKSAVIGLGGRKTIEANHHMLTDPLTTIGTYQNNPMRMDIEQIGKIIGVDLALNVVLDDDKQILEGYFGDPESVMQRGIQLSNQYCLFPTRDTFDLVICSPGGFPKDINLYQAQKAITHACTYLKPNGIVILAAECREKFGSDGFEAFLEDYQLPLAIIDAFEHNGFSIGPHKAYQLALQAKDHPIILVSSIQAHQTVRGILTLAENMPNALTMASKLLPRNANTAILPYATHVFNTPQGDT